MTERPEQIIMQAVGVLHARGIEGVRMRANFYATGHWRCRVYAPIPGDAIDLERDAALAYTNGRQWDLFGDGRASWTPERLADELEGRLDARARRADPAYVVWFRELVARTEGGVFVSYDEYDDWEAQGAIAVFRPGGRPAESMPLPPAP